MFRISLRAACLVLWGAGLTACNARGGQASSGEHGEHGESTRPPLAPAVGYPMGPWMTTDLTIVRQCFAHLLVTHAESKGTDYELRSGGPPNPRTKGEALSIAVSLAAELKAHPDRFETLATQLSEDEMTKHMGGVAGCFTAVGIPPSVMNALGNLQPNQISRVVETSLGYHIVKRLPQSPEVTLGAQQLAIFYAGVITPAKNATAKDRPRDAALALAKQVREEAVQHPEKFADLVKKYSDAYGNSDGDYGDWSIYDRMAEPPVLELLKRTETGRVSAVLEDSVYGFRIFLRGEPRTRRLLAQSRISISHDSDETSKSHAMTLARQVLNQVKRDPSAFEKKPASICLQAGCFPLITYKEGMSGIPDVDLALTRVKLGEVVDAVFDTPYAYSIVRRVAPEAQTPPRYTFTLPAPAPKTVQTVSVDEFTAYIDTYSQAVQHNGLLTATQEPVFLKAMADLKSAFQTISVNERQAALADVHERLTAAFGAPVAERLSAFDKQLQNSIQGQLDDGT